MVTALFLCPLLSRVFGFLSLDSKPQRNPHTYLRNTFRKGQRALGREGGVIWEATHGIVTGT